MIISHDRDTNETDVQQIGQTACKGWAPDNYHRHKLFSRDEISNNSFQMMTSSPDLFSQSLSCVKEVCYEIPVVFSSPRLINEQLRCSMCTKQLIRTPVLFSSARSHCSHTQSPSLPVLQQAGDELGIFVFML